MNTFDSMIALNVHDTSVAPGEPAPLGVEIENLSDEEQSLRLTIHGLEPGWCQDPQELCVGPRQRMTVELLVTIPRSYPAAKLPITITGTLADNPSVTIHARSCITVGDARSLAARLEPGEVEGHHRASFGVRLRNRGAEPEHYRISTVPNAPALKIVFDDSRPLVLPGQETVVKATVKAKRRITGSARRYPFAIVAQGKNRPVELTGAFTSKPVLGPKGSKAAILLAVLLIWGALASIGISAFDSSLHRRAVASQTIPAPPRTAQPVTKRSTARKPSTTTSPKASLVSSTSTNSVTLTGTVAGNSPGGVLVTAAPMSLAAPATLANTQSGSSPNGGGVVYGNSSAAGLNAVASSSQLGPDVSTYTAPDGAFVLAGLKPGVSYLVAFAKPGFTTHKVLITPGKAGQKLTLSVHLVPGTGSLSGVAYGPHGPLGDAKVTVSNGVLSFSTHTTSAGAAVGSWSVAQISTPGTYLVQVTAAGYGTQTTVVNLGPSGARQGVDTHLTPNVGSITGVISSATTNAPLGGAQVSASNGTQTVKATSFTVGRVGAFALPNLAIPGNWTLTFSAPGYQSQTEQINLTGNATVNTVLSQSGGNLTGSITLPNTSGQSTTSTIGLILSNSSQQYKTLSTSLIPGSSTVEYQFPQVVPGVYTLTAEGFGFKSTSTNVTLTAGNTTTTNLTLELMPAGAIDNGTITGSVTAAVGGALPGVPIEMNGQQITTTNSNGSFTINNVAPGVATITAVGTKVTTKSSNGYTTASIQVNVGSGATVTAPTITLDELASISGQVLYAPNNEPIGNVQVPGCPGPYTGSVELTQQSKVIASQPINSSDDYSFTGVAPGDYILKASATCFEPTQVAVTATTGQNLTEQLELSTTPTYSVTVETLNSTSGPSPVGGACVGVTPKGSASSSTTYGLTSSSGVANFANLTLQTTYTVSIDQYNTSPSSANGCASETSPIASQSTSFTAEVNGSSGTVFLTPAFESLSVGLQFPFVDYAASGSVEDCVIDGTSKSTSCPTVTATPTVTLTGVSGYDSSSLSGQVQTTSVSATEETGNGSPTWTFTSTALSAFIGTSAVLHVSLTGFQPFSENITLPTTGGSAHSTVTTLITPTPVPIVLDLPSATTSVTVAPSSIAPNSSTNTLSATASININPSGTGFVWSDTATGHSSGYVEPGIYQTSGVGSGLELAPEEVTISPCSASSGCSESINLTQTALNVTPSNLPSDTAASVQLYCVTSDALSAIGPTQAFVKGTAEFAGLSNNSGSVANGCTSGKFTYEIFVAGNSTADYISANVVSTSSGTATTVNRSPTLVYAAGTISGQNYSGGPASPLGGASIALCASTNISCTQNQLAMGTTNANGSFLLASEATPSVSSETVSVSNSLAYETTYCYSVSAQGYSPASSSTTLSSSSPLTFTLTATPITQVVDVSFTNTSSTPTISVSATTTTSGVTSPVSASSTTSPCSSTAPNTTCEVFDLSLVPTQWTIDVTAPGYSQSILGPFTYEPGSQTQPLPATLTETSSTVQGTVYVAGSSTSTSTTPIYGLQLTLTSTNSKFKETTTTCDPGTNGCGSTTPYNYVFPNSVPAGSYTISVTSSSGYAEQSPVSFATNYPNPTVDNFTVYAADVSATVSVSSPTGVSSSDLTGATVTLSVATNTSGFPISCTNGTGTDDGDPLLAAPPLATSTNPMATVANLTSGSTTTYQASFPSLTPDVYELTVSNTTVTPKMPTQTSSLLDICPQETGATDSVTVDQAEVTGTITVTPASGTTSVTVIITATASGEVVATTTCDAIGSGKTGSTLTCPYQLYYLAFGQNYTISASASGYTITSPTSPSTYPFGPTNASNALQSNDDFTLTG